ncbi:MAG: molybdopterin-dependent oxidoreductase [Henriciella sp.]|nr:molybdopterin-dependent oxidoreductase [Henriciella sp.]
MSDLALSRRGVLKGASGLTVMMLAGGGLVACTPEQAETHLTTASPSAWLMIASDDTVTIMFGATEIGQGGMTALPLIVAEELDADWSKVKVEQVHSADPTFGNPIFGGDQSTVASLTVQGYFDTLRKAGALARRVLIYTAAAHWGVPPEEITTRSGQVLHPSTDRSLSFGDVITTGPLTTDVPDITDADLKAPEGFELIGTEITRLDSPDKSTGAAIYAIDIALPDMAYAAVLAPPVEGETPIQIGDTDARAVSGVVDVLTLPGGVAVIAEKYDIALRARDLLDVTWSETSPFRGADSQAEMAELTAACETTDTPGAVYAETGDAISTLTQADTIIAATYQTDYVYHAQIEPLAAVASVDADGQGAEFWLGTQSQSNAMRHASEALDLPSESIRPNVTYSGGGFGRRLHFERDILRDALLASKAIGRPVKLIWTREDDLRLGWFRPATAQHLRAALTPERKLAAWSHRLAASSILDFMDPARWNPEAPRDFLVMKNADGKAYPAETFRTEHIVTPRRARVTSWRGIGTGSNSFAVESFIDELAHASGEDPADFRLHLQSEDARATGLIRKVMEMSDYRTPRPEGRAIGLALAGYSSSLAAGVAEVSADEREEIKVHQVWTAIECGLAVHPDNVRAQIEGAIIMGLSAALKEQVVIQGGEVQNTNFHDYAILRANEAPEIEVYITPSTAPPTSVGELGLPMVAPAVANAVFNLTGKRLRHLPITPARLNAALRE